VLYQSIAEQYHWGDQMCEFNWHMVTQVDLIAKYLLQGIKNNHNGLTEELNRTRDPIEQVMRLKMFVLEITSN